MHKFAFEFLELYKAGSSLEEISTLYNLSRERVRQIIRTHPEYIPRNRSERMALYYQKTKSLALEQAKGTLECLNCHEKIPLSKLGKEYIVCAKCRKVLGKV